MELTLPTIGQIFGDDDTKQLEVFKKSVETCGVTDFAILTGALCSPIWESGWEMRTADFFTKTCSWLTGDVMCIRHIPSYAYTEKVIYRGVTIRPVLTLFDKSLIAKNKVDSFMGIPIVEYGFYPQMVASKDITKFLNEELEKTINNYIIDSAYRGDRYKSFAPRVISEYIYNNKRYIRFIVDYNCENDTLSNGQRLKIGDIVWIEVSPIRWLYDETTNLLISEKGLVSGIQFDDEKYYGDFEKTNMYRFLNNHLVKDIFPKQLTLTLEKEETELEKVQKAKQKLMNLFRK